MIGAIIAKQAIRSGFDALNKGDLEKFLKAWHEDCIWIYHGNVKAGGRVSGKAEVNKWFEEFFRQFPHRKFTLAHIAVENIFDMMGNNTVCAAWSLELTNKDGFNFANRGITVVRLKAAKAVQGEDFLEISDGDDFKRAWGDIK